MEKLVCVIVSNDNSLTLDLQGYKRSRSEVCLLFV